jgi:hypothetical protein
VSLDYLHTPPAHVCGAAQTMPQLPQLLLSVNVLVQAPPHLMPKKQSQVDSLQPSPAGQSMLQPPQWLRSAVVLTQTPEQSVVGATH